jgi:hypothetical protein
LSDQATSLIEEAMMTLAAYVSWVDRIAVPIRFGTAANGIVIKLSNQTRI